MNLKETIQRIGDSYQVDPDFTSRVLEAAKAKPVRRRLILNLMLVVFAFTTLVVSVSAVGLSLIERRLGKGEPNGLITGERIPGYLESHVNDVILEGATEDGVHIIFTNLLAESRFVYFEVLAERTDGQPLDMAQLEEDVFFRHLRLHYGEAGQVHGETARGVGWGGRTVRLDDSSEPSFLHFTVGLTLLQGDYKLEQLTSPDKTHLTIQLLTAEAVEDRAPSSKELLAEATVKLEDPETQRVVRLSDGRCAKIGALGVQVQGLTMQAAKEEGLDETDFGVILSDGSRVPFVTLGIDLSQSALVPAEAVWGAMAYPEILDPASVAGLYSGDLTLWITEP